MIELPIGTVFKVRDNEKIVTLEVVEVDHYGCDGCYAKRSRPGKWEICSEFAHDINCEQFHRSDKKNVRLVRVDKE